VLDGDDGGMIAHRWHGGIAKEADERLEKKVGADGMTIEADCRMEVEAVATPPFNCAVPVSVNAPLTNR